MVEQLSFAPQPDPEWWEQAPTKYPFWATINGRPCMVTRDEIIYPDEEWEIIDESDIRYE